MAKQVKSAYRLDEIFAETVLDSQDHKLIDQVFCIADIPIVFKDRSGHPSVFLMPVIKPKKKKTN